MTSHIVPKRRLKPFKQFLPECFHGSGQWHALGKTLNEDAIEMAITGASAIVIDSTATDEERVKAINDFAEDIANMSGKIGQLVNYLGRDRAFGVYQVTQLLQKAMVFQYRIKNINEPHERVAKESELRRV